MLTVDRILLGTSIPTAGLPGMGASIRTPAVARFRAISSDRLVIRLTLMPAWGCSSYRVTEGPRQISRIWVLTPKLSSVFTRISAFFFISAAAPRSSSGLAALKRFKDG